MALGQLCGNLIIDKTVASNCKSCSLLFCQLDGEIIIYHYKMAGSLLTFVTLVCHLSQEELPSSLPSRVLYWLCTDHQLIHDSREYSGRCISHYR